MKTQAYISLGGNFENSLALLQKALSKIASHPCICDLSCSNFYQSAPLSPLPQNDYINAVCTFKTSLTAIELLYFLQTIEKSLGKLPKPKEAARPIDLDLIFFGSESHNTPELEIPHPRWAERLFVLVPLSELTSTSPISNSIELVNLIVKLKDTQYIKQLIFN